MKFLKRILVLSLIIGVIWGIWGMWGRLGKGTKEQSKNEIVKNPLRFAVMADVHSDWENFRKALEIARDSEGFGGDEGFVIITGDLTTIGKKSELIEAKKILDESGLKYYVVPGNHDVWWGRKYKENVWEEVFGASFGSFKVGGTKFILVNNGDGIGGIEGYGGFGQKEWIERETEECLKVYCLVFMHEPLNHPNSLHIMGEESPFVASEAAELVNILVKNRVREAFAGHLHFSSSYDLDGLKTTIVGALARERNFQSPKFLKIRKEDGRLEKEDTFVPD